MSRESKAQKEARQAAAGLLASMLDNASKHIYREGDERPTIYVNVVHVSTSGMSRRMRLYVIMPDGTETIGYLADITGLVADATGASIDGRGIRVDGAGMNMRFHLVDTFARLVGRESANDFDIRSL
jgi:hypothetical protein